MTACKTAYSLKNRPVFLVLTKDIIVRKLTFKSAFGGFGHGALEVSESVQVSQKMY